VASPVGMEKLAARLVGAFIGVRAQIVALRLQQISGQARGAIAVKEREARWRMPEWARLVQWHEPAPRATKPGNR